MRKGKITSSIARAVSLILMTTVLLGFNMPTASAHRAWNPPSSSVPFHDVHPNEWFHNDVAWAHTNRITTGTSPTTFSPDNYVTRAQFATFLYRMAGSPSVTAANPFLDVPRGTWFTNAVIWAAETGVTTGTSSTTFRPNRPITREELATMLHRYIRTVRTTHLTVPVNAIDNFRDGERVTAWALDAVRWAAYYGIIGRNGSLAARSNASRAEAVAMLHRVANDFLTDGRTPEHRPPPPRTYTNPLTGLPTVSDITRNRPVAVSLGNTRGALPTNATNGISQADIVYEMLVEYGETRLLALYQDFGAAMLVGSIRSVRHYTVHLADAYDAILIHAGGSPLGMEAVHSRGVTNGFNEVHGPGVTIFRRDINRVPGHPVLRYHSAVTTGAAATSGFSRYGTRTTLRDDFSNTLSFTNNPIPTGGARAHNVNVNFSRLKYSMFTFNEQQNLYTMSQRGSVFRDVNNGAPVTFTNLMILRMPTDDFHDGEGRLDITTIGSGTGHFVSNGRVVAINWSRPDIRSQFVFRLSDGTAIELGRGKTYIGIIPTERINVDVSFW